MPKELDRCVEHLKKDGYDESEAWAICRKTLGYEKSMQKEKNKQITTGQKIDTNYLKEKEKEFKEKFQIDEEQYEQIRIFFQEE